MQLTYSRKFIISAIENRLKNMKDDRVFSNQLISHLNAGIRKGKCTASDPCCLHSLGALSLSDVPDYWQRDVEMRLKLLRESVDETVVLTEQEAINVGVFDI